MDHKHSHRQKGRQVAPLATIATYEEQLIEKLAKITISQVRRGRNTHGGTIRAFGNKKVQELWVKNYSCGKLAENKIMLAVKG